MTVAGDYQSALGAASLALMTIHTVASAIDAVLPQPSAGSKWIRARQVVALLAFNVANARNAVTPGSLSAAIIMALGGISKVGKSKPSGSMTPEQFSELVSELAPIAAEDPMPATAAPLDLAPYAITTPMPAVQTATASAPAATGTASTARTSTMSLWSEIKTFFVDAFDAAEQASIANTVSTDIGAVAGKAGQAVGLLGAVVTGAAATGVLAGDGVKTAQGLLTKISTTVGALSSVTPTSTVTGLLSDAKELAEAIPMGTADRKHAEAVITGLATWLPSVEAVGSVIAAAV